VVNELGALKVARLTPEDKVPVRTLVLQGLAERWGAVDATLNPDLDDLPAATRPVRPWSPGWTT
jgi:hypothetical protein